MSSTPTATEAGTTRDLTVDWLVVLAVAIVSTTGLGLERPWDGTSLELAVTGLVTALPLAVRRTRPMLSAPLVGAALVFQDLIGGSLGFGSFLAALVAMFSVARHVSSVGRSALGGIVLFGAALVATAEGVRETPLDVVFPLFYFSAAWALGRGMRMLEQRSARLEQLNEALARDRETSARLAVASERIRLARELHDVVAHTVMVMVWQAEAAEELLDRSADVERPREALRNIQDAGRRGLADLRTLVGVLREDLDGPEGAPRLDDLDGLTELMSRSGLAVDLSVDLAPHHRGSLPTGLESALYRLVQESLTNVVRHSLADRAEVRVRADGDAAVTVTVVDLGPRRDDPRPGSGHGIPGMRERLAVLGGTVTAGCHADGFRVEAVVPLEGCAV
ncbi:MAG: sensor histidine kinase [Nocardioides sp.]